MDCARDKPRLMAGVLEPCRSVASKGALWFVFLGSPWANWLVPRGSRRGGACHAGEARAMAAMARRNSTSLLDPPVLQSEGIERHVVEPASIGSSRRRRRARRDKSMVRP